MLVYLKSESSSEAVKLKILSGPLQIAALNLGGLEVPKKVLSFF